MQHKVQFSGDLPPCFVLFLTMKYRKKFTCQIMAFVLLHVPLVSQSHLLGILGYFSGVAMFRNCFTHTHTPSLTVHHLVSEVANCFQVKRELWSKNFILKEKYQRIPYQPQSIPRCAYSLHTQSHLSTFHCTGIQGSTPSPLKILSADLSSC